MSRQRWNWLCGASLALAMGSGWNAAAAAPAPKKPVDWVALNPEFAGATFVKDAETCRTCHEDYMKTYAGTRHAKAFAGSPPAPAGECESCHGPRSKHVDDPDRRFEITAGRGGSAGLPP